MAEKDDASPIYRAIGTVIHGRGIGKLIGMPTANLEIRQEQVLPEAGVYIAQVLLDGQIFCGVTHVGRRPTVDNDRDISVETHILNFNQDIYGRGIELRLYKKIRSPEKFENLSLLLDQIRVDCLSAREYWGIAEIESRLHMDIRTHQVKVDRKEICLSNKEFDVLYMLYADPEVVFTKEQIYEAVWHEPSNGYCHAVENTIFQIRKKLRPYARSHHFVKTVVGYGYTIN